MNSNYYRNDKTIWCDKDEQGFAKQIANQKDIFIPFKLELPAGHSIFTVPIPKRYLTRVFSFDNVMLVPVMYSDQAALLNLETESELDETYKFPISVKALFDKTTEFYPDRFSGATDQKTIAQLMTAANFFFYQKQPEGLLHTACFFDWTDLRFQPTNEQTFDEYIQSIAVALYGEPYDPNTHFNALPLSARNVRGANNYLFPTNISDDLKRHIRVRLNIAPNVTCFFSTNGHLRNMGFDTGQIGARGKNKQFNMANDLPRYFRTVTAKTAFEYDLTALATTFKMNAEVNNLIFVSDVSYLEISRKDSLKMVNFFPILQAIFQHIAECHNLRFNVAFDAVNPRFTFRFPINESILRSTIVLPTELSEKLGFEMVENITKHNAVGKLVYDVDAKDTAEKASALAYATGMVMIFDAVNNSILRSNANEKYMAVLYASPTGVFKMQVVNDSCMERPNLILPEIQTSAENYPISFRIAKFNEDGSLTNFNWKEGATLMGVLRGIFQPFQKV